MTPIHFEGSNVVVAKDQPPYLPLPGQFVGGPVGVLLTCWELSEEELAEVTRTRKIWNSVMTFNQPLQPHCLSTDRPLTEDLNKAQDDLFNIQSSPEPETHKNWKVVKVDAKSKEKDKIEEPNLSEGAAYDLAQTLNTRQGPNSTHYYKAITQ